MSQQLKELRVGSYESSKRIMYLAKELLLNDNSIEVFSGTNGSGNVARACETLVRLNYVTISDIRTETNIIEGSRRIKFVMRLTKTADFQKLYEENEANRKQRQLEKTTTPTEKN